MAKMADRDKSEQDHSNRRCFVIGPIGSADSPQRKHADNLFYDVIVPALEAVGFDRAKVVRADHLENPGSINDQMIEHILNADLIIADLSFHNPNAFYELGIADHKGQPVIAFCRMEDSIPFDRRQDRTIVADITVWQEKCEARRMIESYASKALAPDFKVSNPVTQAKGFVEIEASADPKDKIVARLERRIEALEQSLKRSSELAAPGSSAKGKVRLINQIAGVDVDRMMNASEIVELVEDIDDYRIRRSSSFLRDLDTSDLTSSENAYRLHVMKTLDNLPEFLQEKYEYSE